MIVPDNDRRTYMATSMNDVGLVVFGNRNDKDRFVFSIVVGFRAMDCGRLGMIISKIFYKKSNEIKKEIL